MLGRIEWRDWSRNLPDRGAWSDREAFEEFSYRSVFEHLTAVRRGGSLSARDMPLLCVLRNEATRLPLFFDHYKKLGITRFIMIDNNSTDRSCDILLAEKSADVFFTSVSFLEGQGGLYWINGLAHAFCHGHWTLRADADELLIYDGMEEHPLPDLARWLERQGRDRLYAPIRDIYTSAPLDAGGRDIAEQLDKDCWFDEQGYQVEKWRQGWHMTGGPRERLFGHGPEKHLTWLSKYPFFRMTADVSIFNHHYLWPFDKELHAPGGALIHLKLLGDFAERSKRYEREGQHAMSSRAYRVINSLLAEMRIVSPRNADSKHYEGPQSLIRHGLMRAIDWDV